MSRFPTPSLAASGPMTEPSSMPARVDAEPSSPRRSRAFGALLVAEALLAFAPVIILGAAIGWPASLGAPAAQQLQAIAQNPEAVAAGYGLYLLYSVLVAPVMIGLASRVFGHLAHPMAATVAAFALASAVTRAIGILRWLTVMPALAAAHAGADPAMRAEIERQFSALTTYGGGIGEILGVALFMSLSMGTLAVGAWQARSLPRALAASGFGVALLLGSLALPAVGLGAAAAPVAVAVSALSAWLLAAGVWWVRLPRAAR